MDIKTVKVVMPDTASGFMLINEDEFDPAVHQLWEEGEAAPLLPHATEGAADSEKPLDQMTLAELREYAKTHGIGIPAAITAKADVLAHVLASGNASAADGTVQPQA